MKEQPARWVGSGRKFSQKGGGAAWVIGEPLPAGKLDDRKEGH